MKDTTRDHIKTVWILTKRKIKPMLIGSFLGIAMINFLPGVNTTYDQIKQLYRLHEFKKEFIKGDVTDIDIETMALKIAGNAVNPWLCHAVFNEKLLTIRAYNYAYGKEQREQLMLNEFKPIKDMCL